MKDQFLPKRSLRSRELEPAPFRDRGHTPLRWQLLGRAEDFPRPAGNDTRWRKPFLRSAHKRSALVGRIPSLRQAFRDKALRPQQEYGGRASFLQGHTPKSTGEWL